MAKFNSEDQRNLEELLEEGWLDRLKARGAEAVGATKGLKDRATGGFGKALGAVAGKYNQEAGDKISQGADKYLQSGKSSGHNAKIDYLAKNIDKRLASFVADIKNDIKKLGLDIGNIEMVSGINDALNQLKHSVEEVTNTSSQQPQQSQVTPPPLPERQPEVEDEPEPEAENPVEYSYKKAISRPKKKKPQPMANPRKGKVRKDPFAKYAAPEQEEDLDEMFWK